MNKEKIVVCGDSFHSISNQFTDIDYRGTHYSEILADRLGFDLINFACPGASNMLIGLQVKEALEINPDLIILSWAAGMFRCEVNLVIADYTAYTTLGHYEYVSREHPYVKLRKKINILHKSVAPWAMVDDDFFKTYMVKMINGLSNLKEHAVIVYHIIKLVESGIPFLLFDHPPGIKFTTWTKEITKYVDKKNLLSSEDFDFYKEFKNYFNRPPIYHSSPELQVTIADYLEKRIQKIL